MKTLITLLACGFLSTGFSQNVNIPDANFKEYLLSNDQINTNFDDDIQVSEALNFTDSILCVGMQISDLTGIEAFENIVYLSCVNNQLTSLDVSHNTALQGLICAMNNLQSLDVSANVNLRNLRCSLNPIQSLNLNNASNLEYLYCESNQLGALDVSQNTHLIELYCEDNGIFTLDLSALGDLRRLDCSSNPLSQMNLPTVSALEYIMCNGNSLSSIDLSGCSQLVEFRGVGGSYTSLDLSNCSHLQRFDCPFTQLTSLDFSHNPELEVVYCFTSHLTSLNIANGNNQNLQLLWVPGNQLSCIQVDDVAYSTQNWVGNEFQFDSTGVYFSENCSAGLSQLEKPVIELYPNPAVKSVNVRVTEKTNYQLTSANGIIITKGEFSTGDNSLNIEGIPAGVYFFEFTGQKTGKMVQKLQKSE